MATVQMLLTIGAVVLGTMTTRSLPFLIFPGSKPTPKYVQYLGKVLPYAVIGLLVIYCFKGGLPDDGFPRDSGAVGHPYGGGAAFLEEYAPFHRSGNDRLYAAGAAGFLKGETG